jgi:hypothetical protein
MPFKAQACANAVIAEHLTWSEWAEDWSEHKSRTQDVIKNVGSIINGEQVENIEFFNKFVHWIRAFCSF